MKLYKYKESVQMAEKQSKIKIKGLKKNIQRLENKPNKKGNTEKKDIYNERIAKTSLQ